MVLFQNHFVAQDVCLAVVAAAIDVPFVVVHMILIAADRVVVLDNFCAVGRAAAIAAARFVVGAYVFVYVVCFVDVIVLLAVAVDQEVEAAILLPVEYVVLSFLRGKLSFGQLQIRVVADFVWLLQ